MTFVTEGINGKKYDLKIITLEGVVMSKKQSGSEPKLKGTLVSVFAVGIIIIVMWFVVYGLYVAR